MIELHSLNLPLNEITSKILLFFEKEIKIVLVHGTRKPQLVIDSMIH